LKEDDFGPFSFEDADLKNLIFELEYLHISYNIEHLIPVENVENRNCYAWKIYQIFDFSNRNTVKLTLDFERDFCDN